MIEQGLFSEPKKNRLLHTIIRAEDIADIQVTPEALDEVSGLMTPPEILEQTEFEKPEIILPEYFPSFTELIQHRDEIRNLKLVPVKTVQDRAVYHAVPKQMLLRLVEKTLGDSRMIYAPNLFRDNLPEDVEQFIIWAKSHDTQREDIVTFIAQLLQYQELSPQEIILFERPVKTESTLVRGTVKEYRHVHLWKQKEK